MNKFLIIDSLTLVTFAALLCGVLIYAIGPYGWDDGAITLSYARTLAESGRFALTSLSDVTEGTSSLLYVFLITAIWKLLQPDFYNAILMTKLLSLGFLVANTVLIYMLSFRSLGSRSTALAAAALYALIPMNFREALNGMEMLAFGTLLLLYADAYSRRSVFALALIPLLLLCRFESVLYLGFANLVVYLLSKDATTKVFAKYNLLFLVVVFLVLTIFRFGIFDSFLPNTIWAKMNPPYSLQGVSGLLKKIRGGVEFLAVFSPLLVSILVLLALSRDKRYVQTIEPWLAIGFLIFAFAAGKNWGYDGRMVLGLLPVLILWNFRLAAALTKGPDGKPRFPGLSLVVIIPLVLMLPNNARLFEDTLRTVQAAWKWDKRKAEDSELHAAGWYYITPENYKLTGDAVVELSGLLGMDTAKFAAPDVGGLGLCCDSLRILDLALLTNPYLARKGYGVLGRYLEREQPDFIETHGEWSKVSGIYDTSYFQQNYSPLIFKNTLLWARRDLYRTLVSMDSVSTRIATSDEVQQTRYAQTQLRIDHEILATRRVVIVSRLR